MKGLLLAFTLLGISQVLADTPGVCYYEDIQGTWMFSESERLYDHTVTCDTVGTVVYTKEFVLDFPNTVTDELGNSGTWTMVRSQGFEVNINGRSYFAYSYYEGSVSFCDRTLPGWSHDKTVRNWSCFTGMKNTSVPLRVPKSLPTRLPDKYFKNDYKMITAINSKQSAWRAIAYPHLEKYTLEEMHLRSGGFGGIDTRPISPAPGSEELKARVSMLPENFDWRNVSGVNYVSPVRDQGSCGSCFAFASMASLEARVWIATRNARQDVFSTQDVLECSHLSQGCNGGFSYLTAGRYSKDQGVVAESCNPYTATDGSCSTNTTCPRTYVSDYNYIGGYYGACNEELMLETLLSEGPFPVGYMVYTDFYNYDGGVYYHTESKSDFNPHVATSHAVLIVGYGIDDVSGLKYWTCKNSWGADFGESGYFRILRGVNECGIESNAVTPTVIP